MFADQHKLFKYFIWFLSVNPVMAAEEQTVKTFKGLAPLFSSLLFYTFLKRLQNQKSAENIASKAPYRFSLRWLSLVLVNKVQFDFAYLKTNLELVITFLTSIVGNLWKE